MSVDSLRPDERDGLGGLPLRAGLVVGLAAFLAGLLLTTGFVLAEGVLAEERLTERYAEVEEYGGGPALPAAVGWLYFNTQFVDTELTGGSDLETGSANLLAELASAGELTIPLALWRLVPVVTLFAAGFALARRSVPPAAGLRAGAAHGATLVVGSSLAVAAGAVLFSAGLGETTASPTLVQAVGLAGVVYPLVCGGLGGVAAVRLAR
jgi:hypothetical protein